MKKHIYFVVALLCATVYAYSQPSIGVSSMPERTEQGFNHQPGVERNKFVVNANTMDGTTRQTINRIADECRRDPSRALTAELATKMVAAGGMSLFNVVETEITRLATTKKRHESEWQKMRQRECQFIDTIQSVGGQCDFYSQTSAFGPLDPSDMKFDGITVDAYHNGQKVMQLVCHIDTSRLSELFYHSRFYLVLDSLTFRPYQSFLPNFDNVNYSRLSPKDSAYFSSISQFDFHEQSDLTIRMTIDIYSSWINEMVEVFDNVKLGTFTIKIPIDSKDIHDSIYTYSRKTARVSIPINGSSFIVPRSFMPVAANQPSWGTGEYAMKITIAETCRINPEGKRSQYSRSDYRRLAKLYNGGKGEMSREWSHFYTSLKDNSQTIIKATYTPAVQQFFNAENTAKGQGGNMPQGGASGQPPTQGK